MLEKQKVLDLIDKIDEKEIVELTQKLVRFQTDNPPGDYSEISEFVKEEMENVGLDVKISEGEKGKTNVFGLLKGKDESYTLLLSGHMDVVSAGEESSWKFPPYDAEVSEDKVWGRGTVDMKGAIAAQIIAAKTIINSGIELSHNLMVGATVDDEIAGSMGQKYMLEEGLNKIGFPKPSFHILGEASYLDLTVAFKGRIWWELVIKGKAAHGGEPSNGINAIEKTIEFYSRLKSTLESEKKDHPLVGPTTLNFGTINGGSLCNVVPEDCISKYDLRMTPDESTSEWIDKINKILKDMEKEDPSFKYTKFDVFERREPSEADLSIDEIEKLKDIIKDVTGESPKYRGSLSAGDVYHSFMNDVQGLWIGPGNPKLLHQTNENIEISQLLKAAKIYALSILELCVE